MDTDRSLDDVMIRFMTFNIRFDAVADAPGGNRWRDRLDSVRETIARSGPDIVGFQEALRTQLDDLVEAMPTHRGVGKPRDVGETAEYVPLFFDASRFTLEEQGDFWLSPTPEAEGSLGWDTGVTRHCTWVRLEDRASGLRFAVFNTHLDRWGHLARLEATKLIIQRIGLAPHLPAVILGDFNAEEDSEALSLLKAAGFRDTFRQIHPTATDVQTIHHYSDVSGSRKIDYIMCDRHWDVVEADIIRQEACGRLPSDHYPVTARVLLRR